MKNILLLLMLVVMGNTAAQDTIMPLWTKDEIPNQIKSLEKEVHEQNEILRISKVQVPTIEVYLPSKRDATGEAVLIFPGGGYGILAYDWEGTDIAKFFNSKGIAGVVVKYRLPSDVSQKDKRYVPLIDAQRAIRLVRNNAEKFNVESDKIGIIGFSAGGHLASTLGTHFNEKVYKAVDDIDNESARPDFMSLGYPVISFGEMTHQGSKKNLIGENPTIDIVDYFSNEKQVTEQTPPTFLLHATDDTVVPVENSLLFYKAVKDKGGSATMHIYPKGGHGFGLGLHDEHLKDWGERMIDWIVSLR
ncbi:Acetyl esterase/lipase [Maribacter aquivivus]|uniref:Acetyl esterase/lipase n=1 Tax=Maribacter aquivivus TaxID=228958 RepID=A0A1M6S545_9FLAO|nr:alpha/beta hydrolase [Maribacter aquivivus]SHK39825.1 Acetyl esterase/lipase [Maribacter aquivivus]